MTFPTSLIILKLRYHKLTNNVPRHFSFLMNCHCNCCCLLHRYYFLHSLYSHLVCIQNDPWDFISTFTQKFGCHFVEVILFLAVIGSNLHLLLEGMDFLLPPHFELDDLSSPPSNLSCYSWYLVKLVMFDESIDIPLD